MKWLDLHAFFSIARDFDLSVIDGSFVVRSYRLSEVVRTCLLTSAYRSAVLNWRGRLAY